MTYKAKSLLMAFTLNKARELLMVI